MKKVNSIILYQFDELSKEAQDKAIIEHINFEIEVADKDSQFQEVFEEMERMKTPWFTAETIFHTPKYKNMIIESIRINEYYFFSDGELAHCTTYTDGHPKAGITEFHFHGTDYIIENKSAVR